MKLRTYARRQVVAILFFVVVGAVDLAADSSSKAALAATRPWLELETPHFLVRSELPEDRAREVATRLEQFRAVAYSLTGIPEIRDAPRARVYVFANKRSFDPYRDHGRGVAGYFVAQPQGPYITLLGGDAGDERVVYHEFVHLLMEHPRIDVPTWYEEGFAEVLSTFRVKKGRAQVGRPVHERLEELRFYAWPANAGVLSVTTEMPEYHEMKPTFHTQAWALVHYLMFGKPERLSQLDAFLARWQRGEDPQRAFAVSFGVEYADLWKQVAAHLRQQRLPFGDLPITEADAGPGGPARTLTSAEAHSALGELLLALGDRGALRAAPLFGQALQEDPGLALPKAGIARAYDLSARYDEAGALFDLALAESPQNLQILLMRGDHLARVAISSTGASRTRGLAEARQAYRAAAALHPSSAAIVLRIGLTYLYEPGAPDEGRTFLESAVRKHPHSRALAEAAARLELQQERRDEARQVLARASHASAASLEVDAWLAAIEGNPAPPQRFDALMARIGRRPPLQTPASAGEPQEPDPRLGRETLQTNP